MKTKSYSSPCMKVNATKIRMSILAGSTKGKAADQIGVGGNDFPMEDGARMRKVNTSLD